MLAFKMETLKSPGLRPIKQEELFKTIRPYVPRGHRNEICPQPSGEVLEVRQEKQNSKQVGASATTAAKMASQQKLQKAADQQKHAAKAKHNQKKAERESIAAEKVKRGKR
jgi:hypothetical protein